MDENRDRSVGDAGRADGDGSVASVYSSMKESMLMTLQAIRDAVWDRDIPSPMVPEYVEHHRDMQEILAIIDKYIEEVKNG